MTRLSLGIFLAVLSSPMAMAGFEEGKKAFNAKDYSAAVKEWQPLAAQGDAKAMGQMALLYYSGEGVPEDKTRAAEIARQAAEKNEPYAQNLLGILAQVGEGGIKQDMQEAAAWYRKAADQGLAAAQVNLGILYWDGKGAVQDKGIARYWFQKAANQGYAAGEFELGYAYVNTGIKDFVNGARWYRKAARQGHATAQLYLAEIYNFSVTKERLQRAYDNEETDHLGDWQSIANATPRDVVIAYVLYTLAARGGAKDRYDRLAALEKEMSPTQKEEASALLTSWKPGQEFPEISKTGAAQRIVDAPPPSLSR